MKKQPIPILENEDNKNIKDFLEAYGTTAEEVKSITGYSHTTLWRYLFDERRKIKLKFILAAIVLIKKQKEAEELDDIDVRQWLEKLDLKSL